MVVYDVTDKDMDLNDSISYDEFRNRTEFLFTKRLTYYRKNQFNEGCFQTFIVKLFKKVGQARDG